MNCHVLLLAGGKGTRSLNPNQPKVSQIVGNQSLLDWHSDLFRINKVENVSIVGGHLSEKVLELLETSKHSFTGYTLITEDNPQGTVAAVKHAHEILNKDRYIVLLADILMSFDMEQFASNWTNSKKNVGVIVHPSLHPKDSDATYVDSLGQINVVKKSQRSPLTRNISSAGVFALTSDSISLYGELSDIGSDILSEAAKNDDLFVWSSSHYLKDTGTPERLNQAEIDFGNGAITRRGSMERRSAIFLDRDGVINPNYGDKPDLESFQVNEGVASAISRANQIGIPVFIVTNQPGLAKGFFSFSDHEKVINKLENELLHENAYVDEYVFCPHHPETGFTGEIKSLKISCTCRKPSIGMMSDISERHGIDLSQSIMVGDMFSDYSASISAEMEFVHVATKCSFDVHIAHSCFPTPAAAIDFAISGMS
jgi:mannose-1-phosphate guanylyltransferase/phosphomannomutase